MISVRFGSVRCEHVRRLVDYFGKRAAAVERRERAIVDIGEGKSVWVLGERRRRNFRWPAGCALRRVRPNAALKTRFERELSTYRIAVSLVRFQLSVIRKLYVNGSTSELRRTRGKVGDHLRRGRFVRHFEKCLKT